MYLNSAVLAGILAFTATTVLAHGGSHDAKQTKKAAVQSTEEHPFGRAGLDKKVARTIDIGMHDSMRFTPGDIRVKQGETVRFVASNEGKVMHEMVIGSMSQLKEHSELMRKFPNMEHDEPYMAHVKPGAKEGIVWEFTKAGEFYYACLIPGHFEAGMVAKIIVEPRK